MDARDKAMRELLAIAGNADAGMPTERARVLALQWPSLAAALANLLAAHDMPVPRPFRAAANVLAAEADEVSYDPKWCYCQRRPYRHVHFVPGVI